jgi:UTP--glucose-1-phosphate uridylyltransferase
VPLAHVSRYGIVTPPRTAARWWDVEHIVEKPAPELAPSRWAVVGRYVLTPDVFGYLKDLEPGVGGEYQLTDALAAMAGQGRLVAATIPAKRFDTGNKLDYLKANVEFALKREDLGVPFLDYLKQLVSTR